MSYYSEYYLKEFENDVVKKLTIILNKIEIHSKQKYLLIVAKDLETDKIVKLIDAHGAKYDLCKYSDDWAKLNKGDVISVKCEFYNSRYCVNVLRIKSNYALIESIDLHKELKEIEDSLPEKDELILNFAKKRYSNIKEIYSDILIKQQAKEKSDYFAMKHQPDLYFLSKKFSGKYGFVLYYIQDKELIKYKTKNSNKIKYQFSISLNYYCDHICFADVNVYESDIQERVGQSYTGFVLLQFAYKNDRLRAKVYDLLSDNSWVEENLPFWLKGVKPC